MITRIVALVAGLALLAGCGGGLRGSLPPVGAYDTASPADDDELLAAELSAKRLEELYAKSGIPGWDPSLEEELKRWDHQVKFDVPIQMNKQVRAYLVYFSTERKDIIRRHLARSTRYLPMIKEIFQEYGLPEDLAYLAMVESGFNPNAYSPAGACGMWQFIKSTGQRYGLVIDGYVDERRDPVKSSRAAAQYLLDLYKQFGSWYLAAASYNCGERRVQQELSKSHHNNFWELSAHRRLPDETKNYVPQMIAATIIAKNPERFGFKDVPYQQPLTAEQLAVAEPARNIAATRVSKPGVGYMPVHTVKGNLSSSQAKSQPGGQSALARQSKKPARVAYAKIDQAKANPSTSGNSNLRVASLFGATYTASDKYKRQMTAGTKKGKPSRAVTKNGKKNKPVLLAMKNENKNTRARKKARSSTNLNNGKLVKARPKPMLVSEAR
jgi:soluble lytic murein transglycosylase-like protein